MGQGWAWQGGRDGGGRPKQRHHGAARASLVGHEADAARARMSARAFGGVPLMRSAQSWFRDLPVRAGRRMQHGQISRVVPRLVLWLLPLAILLAPPGARSGPAFFAGGAAVVAAASSAATTQQADPSGLQFRLSAEMDNPATADAGITLSILVVNHTGADLANLTVRSPIPAEAVLVDAAPEAAGAGAVQAERSAVA